jgi:hypothetical protein
VLVPVGEVPDDEAGRQPFAAAPVRRQGVDAGRRIGESFEDASSPTDGMQPRGEPPVISGLVPVGGEVGRAEAEREFHHPGPVVHAGFEVAGRGGHAERGQPVVQAGDGAQAGGRRAVLPWVAGHLARGGAGGRDLGGEDGHGVQDVGVDRAAG